ncbi:MAG: Na+/H+ antiporter NhaC family protein [Lachnospiraceae bacterium]|nr:Na+/H+ antiporter NhaC family protein [Lachnospiraceae bacterium]
MSNGMIAILIILVIIVGAIYTRRCTEFLLLGSVLGAIVLYRQNFLTEWCNILQEVVADNAWLWLVCGLFGSLIAVLQASKGTFGFSKILSRICTTEKRTLLASFVMGILIFVDDYLNVLSIGVCMKGVFDKRKIPRESLAFVLDSTGAPVCVLLPFSTWAVFYASLFIEQESVSAQFSSGMDAYLHAIPFCFYPFIALLIVLLFALGLFPKLGAMKKAYRRVEETGKVYSDASKKYNHDDRKGYEEDGNVWNFMIPMIVLVGIGVATGDILLAVIVALVVCLILYVPTKLLSMEEFFNLLVQGFGDMLSIFFMLVAAFSLETVCSELGLTEFLIEIARPLLSAQLFPAIAFLLLAVLAFVTGSNWGMSAVVIPILIPMCSALGANLVLTMAAIISGGAFGSHACFYTDATVLASNSAGIDNMEHAMTQLPYVMIAAALSTVGFLAAGFLM